MEVNSHCQGTGWNEGGSLGWAPGGEEGAPTAWGGCGLFITQLLCDLGGARTLPPSIRHSRALGWGQVGLPRSPQPPVQTCYYSPGTAPLP